MAHLFLPSSRRRGHPPRSRGCDLPDLAAIVAKALIGARSILSAEALEGRIPFNMRLDVEDEGGVIVHSLPFADAIVIVPAH
jgi:hypothetical protein